MINGGATLLQTYQANPRPLPPHPGEPRAPVNMSLSIRYTPAKEVGCLFCSMRSTVVSHNSPTSLVCSAMRPSFVPYLPQCFLM